MHAHTWMSYLSIVQKYTINYLQEHPCKINLFSRVGYMIFSP
uniref:Uncharacterized protein n=1 Tax=Lotus japonicus TaxID=34305 RepID=I3SJ73_LOTJA|nr:unknown [Lotus japonicus]